MALRISPQLHADSPRRRQCPRLGLVSRLRAKAGGLRAARLFGGLRRVHRGGSHRPCPDGPEPGVGYSTVSFKAALVSRMYAQTASRL